MNPVHILTSYFVRPYAILSSQLCLDFPSGLFSSENSSLCNFLHPLVTYSLLGPSVLLSTVIKHPQPTIFPQGEDQFSRPYKARCKIKVLEILSPNIESDVIIIIIY
jgi:hypothetical protein